MIYLNYPFRESDVRRLRIGDAVAISGILCTGRDRLHQHLHEDGRLPLSLRDGALYHCGPVSVRQGGEWKIVAAGPTTSSREEPYEADVIAHEGIRVLLGKGGMGSRTLAACQKYGCVYLQTTGGAAALLADCIVRVRNVHFLEAFGPAEAMWELEVKDLPAIVGMDTHGNTLFGQVRERSTARLQQLLGE